MQKWMGLVHSLSQPFSDSFEAYSNSILWVRLMEYDIHETVRRLQPMKYTQWYNKDICINLNYFSYANLDDKKSKKKCDCSNQSFFMQSFTISSMWKQTSKFRHSILIIIALSSTNLYSSSPNIILCSSIFFVVLSET